MEQLTLELPAGSGGAGPAAEPLATFLGAALGKPVTVVFTNNRSTMISWRNLRGGVALRLHRAFATAGAAERHALVAYLTDRDPAAGRLLDAFLAQALVEPPPARAAARPAGRFHDLAAIFTQLNARYFHGACRAQITWGQAGARRYRRSIQLGCYVARQRLIRIHPSLDQAFVPARYVAWVVFHEMLHEVFGVEARGRRRALHPPAFGALEESYPGYQECKAWEERHLHRLLTYRPTAARRRGR